MPVIPLPLIVFIILLLPWAIVALGIIYIVVGGIVRTLVDNHKEKKDKEETAKCDCCPDYVEGPNEDL